MRSMAHSLHRVAPWAVVVLALLVGAFISVRPTVGSDFANSDVNGTSISNFVLPGGGILAENTSSNLDVAINNTDQGPFEMTLTVGASSFPKSGQVTVYTYPDTTGAQADLELMEYDNNDSGCTLAGEQLCITSRGTPKETHDVGSIVKAAAILQTANITVGQTPPFDITVDDGSIFALEGDDSEDTILINSELFTLNAIAGNTLTVSERTAESSTDNPTTAGAHAAGDVVQSPDAFVSTISRTAHDLGDNTLSTTTQSYTRQNPELVPAVMRDTSTHPFNPTIFPQGYVTPAPTTLTGVFDKNTGQTILGVTPCTNGILIDLTVQTDKDTGTEDIGSITIIVDGTEPLDCNEASATTPLRVGSLEAGVAPDFDSDLDGCSNWRELNQADPNPQTSGGLRDPWNHWDFFDVPTGLALTKDGAIIAADIASLVTRFGSNDATAGTFDKDSDPLSTPNAFITPSGSRQNYHPAFDRGGALLEAANPWNLAPADGAVAAGDIAALVIQFGHVCV